MLLTVMLPLQPLFANVQEIDNLPACCRRNGAHHCMMLPDARDGVALAISTHSAFTPPPCPWKLAVVPAIVAAAAAHFMPASQRADAGRVVAAQSIFFFLPGAGSQSTRAPPAVLL